MLAKWLADPEADSSWHRLARDLEAAPLRAEPPLPRVYSGGTLAGLVAAGLSNREIADEMGITVEAVKCRLYGLRLRLRLVGCSRSRLVSAIERETGS